MSEYEKEEKAIVSIQRRLDILMMFSRKDQQLTTKEIANRLRSYGDDITDNSVFRALKLMEKAGFLEVANRVDNDLGSDEWDEEEKWDKEANLVSKKGCKWRWPMGLDSRIKVFPKFTIGEIIAFRLVDMILKPLLPKESYQAVQPYLMATEKQCEMHPKWQRINQWERKVRVVAPTQPLLSPQSPFQEQVRETILEALFKDRQCKIYYQIIQKNETVEWIIHPLVYLQSGPAFYIICMVDSYADTKGLALHRIRSAELLDNASRKPEGFNYDDYIDKEIARNRGMGGSSEPIRLVLRFWRDAGLHLQETRLSEDQVIYERDGDDDHLRITATVRDTSQLRWWLLSFGSNVEVLEPETLRAEMLNIARSMYQIYSNMSE